MGRVGASEAELDLASVKEFAEIVRHKSGPLIGTDNGRFERGGEAHLGGDIGCEDGKRGSGNDGCGAMARKHTSVARSGIDNTAVVGITMEKTLEERTGEVHVKHGTGWRLAGKVEGRGVEGLGTSTAT